ncbi:MAG: MATE family efflux transporter [Fusobacteriaceae bacterium]
MLKKIKKIYWNNRIYIGPVFTLALPTIADMFVQTLLGFFDMVMVGRLGATAINAVGIGNSPLLLITTIFFALSTGTTAIMSRAHGSSNKKEGRETTAQTIFLALPVAIFCTLFLLIFKTQILNFIAKGENLILPFQYYTPIVLGIPFVAYNIVFASLFRAVGSPKIPMICNIISVATNIFLNYLFIFKLNLGVAGAAWATTIARGIVTFIYFYVIFIQKNFWVTIPKKYLKYNKHITKRILDIGAPAALEQGLFRVGMLIFEILVIRLGVISYASHKIALTAESFSFNLGFGFAMASTTLVGQQLGKNSLKEAEKYAFICTATAVLVMSTFGVIFLIFPKPIISMFTHDSEIKILASDALRIVSICQPFLAVSMVLNGSLRGAGCTKSVLVITALGMFLIRLPLTYFLLEVIKTGLLGAWVVMTADLAFRSVAAYNIFKKGKWKYIRV